MKKIYLNAVLFIFMLFLMQCNNQNNEGTNEENKVEKINCNQLSSRENGVSQTLSAINDSVVVLTRGKVNDQNWSDFLSKNVLNEDFKIIDCLAGTEFETWHKNYSITYKNKCFLIKYHRNISVYNPIKNEWEDLLEGYDYQDKIYAENGKLKRLEKSLIIEPAPYTSIALKLLNEQYKTVLENGNFKKNYNLRKRLFEAALGGHQLSRKRFLDLKNKLPESENIDEEIKTLIEYETYLKNGGKRIFLNLNEYEAFQ